jgi:hypothetical protein
VTLDQPVLQVRWVFKELQVRQAHVAQLVRKGCVAKQAQLVYKDLQAQQAPQVQLAHKDY